MEPPTTVAEAEEGKFEQNAYYFTRNGLTTVATLIYTYYNLRYTYLLQKILAQHQLLREAARTKVVLQCLLIQVIVFMRVAMIWSSNHFWYSKSTTMPWLYFIVIYELTSEIIPFSIFIFVLIGKINRHIEMRKGNSDQISFDDGSGASSAGKQKPGD